MRFNDQERAEAEINRIEHLYASALSEIKTLKEQLKQTTDIAKTYAWFVYQFIGNFSQDNLTSEQKLDITNLKKTIDAYLKDTNGFKYYLQHKFIDKDLIIDKVEEKLYNDLIESTTNKLFEEEYQDRFLEDDTETLKIIDKESN